MLKYIPIFLIVLGLCVCTIMRHNDPITLFPTNKVAEEKEKISNIRYPYLQAQFSMYGDNIYLRSHVKRNIKDKVISDHISTQWIDQFTFITVKSSYKLQDNKGNKFLISVKADINDDGKILKYEEISYDNK